MEPFKKFLKILEWKSPSLEWSGWLSGGNRDNTNLRGSFISFETIVKGFEIKISYHDYRAMAPRVPRSVFDRRGINYRIKEWVEITVSDRMTRSGRKNIIPRMVLLKPCPEYKLLMRIFKKIRVRTVIFVPNKMNRLTVDKSIIEMCEIIGVRAPR